MGDLEDVSSAHDSETNPAPIQLASDVWQIFSPIPEGQIRNTLTYALKGQGSGIHLIDPGWDSTENLARLESSLTSVGFSLQDIVTVVATHHHPDHLGLAGRLRAISGATIVMSAIEVEVLRDQQSPAARDRAVYEELLESWGVPHERRPELREHFDRPTLVDPVSPDRAVSEGDTLSLGSHRLAVLATPGHTSGHICLIDSDRQFLYSGDHILPRIFAGVGIGSLPGTSPLVDYIESLSRLAPYGAYTVLPGHEHIFRGLDERRRVVVRHHLRRTEEVRRLGADLGDAPVWDYAQALTWTSGWAGLTGFALHSALSQTSIHREAVRSGQATELLWRG